MKKTILCLALIYISTSSVHGRNANHPCGDVTWTTYKDEKCFKLFKSFEIRHRAEDVCNQQDSKLATIKSSAEQMFLIDYVFNSSTSNDVWIGVERRLNSVTEFVWNDGSTVQRFTNWAIGRPSDVVSRSCVLMQSILTRRLYDMEWVDVSCTNGNWFICEKIPFWPYEQLQQAVLRNRRELEHSIESFTNLIDAMQTNFTNQLNSLTNQMTDMRNTLNAQATQLNSLTNLITATSSTVTTHGTQITSNTNLITATRNTVTTQGTQITSNTNLITATRNTVTTQGTRVQSLQDNPVPINFIYVQLPNQPDPRALWANVGWTEITSQYAGLFFRAQGGGSAAFGTVQAENCPRLQWVDRFTNMSTLRMYVEVPADGALSLPISTGASSSVSHWGLAFSISRAEVRPRNQAVRIWRRST